MSIDKIIDLNLENMPLKKIESLEFENQKLQKLKAELKQKELQIEEMALYLEERKATDDYLKWSRGETKAKR